MNAPLFCLCSYAVASVNSGLPSEAKSNASGATAVESPPPHSVTLTTPLITSFAQLGKFHTRIVVAAAPVLSARLSM